MEKKEKIAIGKEVALHQSFTNAWVENRMIFDKQLLAVSLLGIGFLVVEYGDKLDYLFQIILWLIANGAFLITAILVFVMFEKNATYLELVMMDDETKPENIRDEEERCDKELAWLTLAAKIFAIIGVAATILLILIESFYLN